MRVMIMGVGQIAPTQIAAIESIGAEVVALVDPHRTNAVVTSAGPLAPRRSLADIDPHDVDTVVIATPTETHASAVAAAAAHLPGTRLIVEKPLAIDPASYASAWDEADRAGCEVVVLLHAACAPEVGWAEEHITGWIAEHGRVVGASSRFCDPYSGEGSADRRASLVSSWIDSGINSLSVLDRLFALGPGEQMLASDQLNHGVRIEGLDPAGNPFPIVVFTSWTVSEPSKSTTLDFEDGAHVILDHQAMQAWRWKGDALLDIYRVPDQRPRLAVHYGRMMERLASEGWMEDRARSDRLHRLLFALDD